MMNPEQSDTGLDRRRPRELPVLLALPLVAGLALLAVVFGPFALALLYFQERLFVRRMKTQDRFVAWAVLEPRLVAGEGTLIVEQAQKQEQRVWWTAENPLEIALVAPPPEEELDYLRCMKPHPFVDWCERRYLNAATGTALLTAPPYGYPPGFIEAAFFLERFPSVQVVMTVKSRP